MRRSLNRSTVYRARAGRSESRRLYLRVGDRVYGPEMVGGQGTVRAIVGPMLVEVAWDNGSVAPRCLSTALYLCATP